MGTVPPPSYSTVTRWGCWNLTWPNITWIWHPSWPASWSNHWWLLPCCRKAGDGRSTTESLKIATEVGVSYGSVLNILLEHSGLSNVHARWVSCFLTPVQKTFWVETCSELLAIYSATPDNVLSRIITGDETWIHHWDSDTKQESMQWKHVNSPLPRKFRTQPSVGKSWPQFSGIAKACCWWITTMTGPYYGEVLTNLRQAVKEKRRGILTRGPLLLHGNVSVHMSRVAQAVVKDIGFEQLSHPPYSPDLAPSDFYLFRLLKQNLRGTRFFDDDELWQPMESYLDNMPRNSIWQE